MVFDHVTCEGELFITDIRLGSPLLVKNLVTSGYTTFRSISLDGEQGGITIQGSTFNGDLDLKSMDSEIKYVERVHMNTCWVTGHMHILGGISSVELKDTTFNGPLAVDIRRGSSPTLSLLNSTVKSSAQFRWTTVDADGDEGSGVKQPLSCRELYEAIRGPKDEPPRFSPEEMSLQMLLLRSVMVRMGRFDDSDFFLRKYNQLHRRPAGGHLGDVVATWASRAGSVIARVIGSYGTRPGLILLWMFIVPLVVGGCLAYFRGDVLGGFLDGFVAFITMSLGVETSGLGDAEKVLLVVDGFIGVFLMSFFVTSLARKLFR